MLTVWACGSSRAAFRTYGKRLIEFCRRERDGDCDRCIRRTVLPALERWGKGCIACRTVANAERTSGGGSLRPPLPKSKPTYVVALCLLCAFDPEKL